MQSDFEKIEHNLTINNRQIINLTGISDVPNFDESEFVAKCDYGEIIIKGENLKIEVLDVESGKLSVKGKIIAVYYNEKQQVKGFFKRALSN